MIEDYKVMMDKILSLRWANVTGEGSSFLNPDYIQRLTISQRYPHGFVCKYLVWQRNEVFHSKKLVILSVRNV